MKNLKFNFLKSRGWSWQTAKLAGLFLAGSCLLLQAEPLELAGPDPAPAPAATAATPAADAAAKAPAGSGEIEITADSMDMDFAAHLSTLTGHVTVTDARMKLQADKMIVYFAADDKPERIEAIGNVTIEQPDVNRKAKAGKAEYNVVKGMIVLTEKPVLSMGTDTMSGPTKITYYRDEDRVTTEGAPSKITITPKTELKIPDVLGGEKK